MTARPTFRKLPRLVPGQRIALIAPSGPFDVESFERGREALSRRYVPTASPGISERTRYLAGSDARRLEELRQAFTAQDTAAVFCARGGYGAMRLLPSLDIAALPHKPLIGFSDITALHLAWQAQGRVSVHGPVLTQFGKQPPHVVEHLWKVLEDESPAPALNARESFVGGVAEGPLLGGNLSVFTRLLGTPYMPDLTGAVLLLEDVGERPYRLDRMWTHLRLAGVFEKIRGIALGEFTGCDEKDGDHGANDVLRELARETKLPCASGFVIGHGELNFAVPLGVQVRLDADARTLTFLEPATEAIASTGGGRA